jgi:hypothetical protein
VLYSRTDWGRTIRLCAVRVPYAGVRSFPVAQAQTR